MSDVEPNPPADITTFPANRRSPGAFTTGGLFRPETIRTPSGRVFIDPQDQVIRLDTRDDIRQEIKMGNLVGVPSGYLNKVKTFIDRKRKQFTTYYFNRECLQWIIITSPLPEGKTFPQGMNPVGFNNNAVQGPFKASRRGPKRPPTSANVRILPRACNRGLLPWLGLQAGSNGGANLTESSGFQRTLTEREQVTRCLNNAGGIDPTGLCGFGGHSQKFKPGAVNPRNRSARGVRLTVNM